MTTRFPDVDLPLFHGSNEPIEDFDCRKTIDGGIHFGSRAQAQMRNSLYVMECRLSVKRPRRCRDDGGGWKAKIVDAKKSGFDGIVYLNRYEGLTTERILDLDRRGVLSKLDSMPDSRFKKFVPEATDSYIVFSDEQISVVSIHRREDSAIESVDEQDEEFSLQPSF